MPRNNKINLIYRTLIANFNILINDPTTNESEASAKFGMFVIDFFL